MNEMLIDKQGWNDYWTKKNPAGPVYAVIAEFYRKVIIRPTLNHFIRKHFARGAKLLHAGCGSGQVDADIMREYSITGLDISPHALEIFRQSHEGKSATLHASIFETGLGEGSFDGIYNLGVMEHFSEEEIHRILLEFRRVLVPGGKAVLFWPPEYGASVLFFKGLRGAIKALGGKDRKFHPDEICRVKSKASVSAMVTAAGFEVVDYSFGPRDAFTYSIIVAQRPF